MGFLSITFLAALPLAAAPILLHLFDRRRNVVIEWGAMQFLMEAATRRTSARKLKQWLLLLMRVMAVAALVLALSRPMLPGNWFGNTERGETVFVVDNSMSMMRVDGDGPLIDTAIERAVSELQEIAAGDSVRILLASPYPVWATDGSVRIDSRSRQLMIDELREIHTTNGGSDLLSALFTAVQAELEPPLQRRRIVLLTDGQRTDWSTGDEAGWKRFQEVLSTAIAPTELSVIELNDASREVKNLAVNGIEAGRTVVGLNQSFTLTARVQNHGLTPSLPCEVTWQVGSEEEHSSHVPSLDAGAVLDVVWTHSFADIGVQAISCAIDAADELPPDDRATIVVDVVEEVPVLLLEGAPELAEMQRDAFLVQVSLGWVDGEPLAERGVHVPTVVDPERLERMDLRGYRAIIVPNLTQLSVAVVTQLQEFVADGGGLWIALGPRTDTEAFNELLFADGEGLAPLAVDGIVEDEPGFGDGEDDAATGTRIDPFAEDHPAVAELIDTERLDVDDVTVSRRFRFVPPPAGENVSTLLKLTNGEPFAVEKYFGRGRVIVQTVPLRSQWSELVRSQAFVVMVRDWLAYLTQPRATRHNLSPGDPISVHMPDSESHEATLRTPHGDEIELTADVLGDGLVFQSGRTILPGDYALEFGLSGDRIPFHVNRDVRESDLTPLAATDRELLAELAGLSRGRATATFVGTNQADPLWPILLTILIALMTGELLLSGMISRERFGSAPISETTEPWAEPSASFPTSFREPIVSSPHQTPAPTTPAPTAPDLEPVVHQTSMN